MIERKQARKNLRYLKNDVCQQINTLRRSKRLTLEYLSFETGIPIHYLDKLESGLLEINLGTLNQIARALDKKIKIELID